MSRQSFDKLIMSIIVTFIFIVLTGTGYLITKKDIYKSQNVVLELHKDLCSEVVVMSNIMREMTERIELLENKIEEQNKIIEELKKTKQQGTTTKSISNESFASRNGDHDIFNPRNYSSEVPILSKYKYIFDYMEENPYINYTLGVSELEYMDKLCEQYNINPHFVVGMMYAESRFTNWDTSSADARGLLQIIPSTGEWLYEKVTGSKEGWDPELLYDPYVNIRLALYYIDYLRGVHGEPYGLLDEYSGGANRDEYHTGIFWFMEQGGKAYSSLNYE